MELQQNAGHFDGRRRKDARKNYVTFVRKPIYAAMVLLAKLGDWQVYSELQREIFDCLFMSWRDGSGAVRFDIEGLLLFVGCLTSQQHASVSQGQICTDYFTCCHTEIEVAAQYTDTGPTCPSADPIVPGAWQGSHWSANF